MRWLQQMVPPHVPYWHLSVPVSCCCSGRTADQLVLSNLCKNTMAPSNQYSPDHENARADEESQDYSRELIFSNQATFVSVFTKLDMETNIG